MNWPLTITCVRWIDVDLEFCLRIQKVLVLRFRLESFWITLFMNPLDYNGCFFVVNPWIITFFFESFLLSLGFVDLNQNSLNLPWIYVGLDSMMFLSKKEVSSDFYLCLFRRFELKFLGILESDSALLISGLNSENKSVNFFLLLLRFRNLESFLLLLKIRISVIAFRVYCFLRWTLCLNCRGLGSVMKVQSHLWELIERKLHWFVPICFWENG